MHFHTQFPHFQGYWVRLNGIDRKLGDPFCYQIQFIFTPNFPLPVFQYFNDKMNEIDIERRRNNHKTSGKRNLTSRGSLKQGFKVKLMRKEWGCPLFGTIKGNHLNFSGLLLKNDWVLGSHLSVCYTVYRDKHFEVWFISNPLILHLLSPTSSFQAYWVRLNGIDRK